MTESQSGMRQPATPPQRDWRVRIRFAFSGHTAGSQPNFPVPRTAAAHHLIKMCFGKGVQGEDFKEFIIILVASSTILFPIFPHLCT